MRANSCLHPLWGRKPPAAAPRCFFAGSVAPGELRPVSGAGEGLGMGLAREDICKSDALPLSRR
ncbi:hypothetical protein ACFSKU_15540 [Pontibacter silvestris]|uniref:Uncharacterized protein n=1 Tax=Pontibacter silvestris TaxID=2305183 RepID=A0ABW4X044_9BACT